MRHALRQRQSASCLCLRALVPACRADATMVNTSSIQQITRDSTDLGAPKKVAFLTAGGLAPCLSAAVGGLITEYASKHPSTEIICYINGYQGLLMGNSVLVTPGIRATAAALQLHGGSPIGNSRAAALCRRLARRAP